MSGPLNLPVFKKRLALKAKVVISLVLTGLAILCFPVGEYLLQRFENRTIDYRFLIQGPQFGNKQLPIIMVFIDNDSALEYGYRSPTPRKMVANLINHLNNSGARAIGVDVLMEQSYHQEDDALLEAVLAKTNQNVVLVEEFNADQTVRKVMPRFAKHTYQGFSSSRSKGDDFHRWARMYVYPHQKDLSLKLFEIYTGKPCKLSPRLNLSPDNPWILLNFPGPPSRLENETNNFTTIAAGEVPYIPGAFFKDKIILIGSAIEDLGDIFLTSFSTQKNNYMTSFGVELQAVRLKMLFENAFIYPLTTGQQLLFLCVLFLISTAAFLILKPALALGFLPLGMLAWCGLAVYGFSGLQLIFPIIYPLFALIVLFTMCQWLIHVTEVRHSKFLKNSFQHYISPALVDQLVTDQEEISLGGKKENLSVFFSDLQGFTSISERLEPEALIDFLHQYFEEMNQILFEEKGTLDKYIGDAIMAFFGAPGVLADHAVRACRTAIRMQHRIAELNRKPEGYWFPITVRTGINTAPVIVGNTGSSTRFDYTVMGDGVNLASRLESVNKQFGTLNMISEFTLNHIEKPEHLFFMRELGRLVVKGKLEPVKVFELIDFVENANAKQIEIKKSYEKGLQNFYQQDFKTAETIFSQLKTKYKDGPSAYMLKQCRHLHDSPPEKNWGGEIVLLTK